MDNGLAKEGGRAARGKIVIPSNIVDLDIVKIRDGVFEGGRIHIKVVHIRPVEMVAQKYFCSSGRMGICQNAPEKSSTKASTPCTSCVITIVSNNKSWRIASKSLGRTTR